MMSPAAFARGIAKVPDKRLAGAMRSRLRYVVLNAVFSRMEKEFVPERAEGLDAVYGFDITGRRDGGVDSYQVVVRDRTCKAGRALGEEPRVKLTLDGVQFLKLVTGVESGMDMYLSGKLKFDGEMLLLNRLASVFRIPNAAARPVTR